MCHKYLRSWGIKPWWITSLIKRTHHQSPTNPLIPSPESETNKRPTGRICLRYRITLLQMSVLLPRRLFSCTWEIYRWVCEWAQSSGCSLNKLSSGFICRYWSLCVVQHVIFLITQCFIISIPYQRHPFPKENLLSVSEKLLSACLSDQACWLNCCFCS